MYFPKIIDIPCLPSDEFYENYVVHKFREGLFFVAATSRKCETFDRDDSSWPRVFVPSPT